MNTTNNVTGNQIIMGLAGSVHGFVQGIFRWAMVAVLLHIAASLNPELSKQFPVIFEFANGTLRVANLIIKWLMELLYSIKGLHFFRFFRHWWGEVGENFKIFLSWIQTTGKWW